MKVRELGEFGLIDYLARLVTEAGVGGGLVVGIGDDAACWKCPPGLALATTDSQVEGVHFLKDKAAPEEVGWKALAINLSDIAAMGGTPGPALISLALPGETEVEWVGGLYRGLGEAARSYGVAIAGGDVHAASQIVITVALWGGLAGEVPLTRSAARPGEAIAVTGPLGGSAGGLRMLKEGLSLPPEVALFLRQAHLHPQPRLREGQLLLQAGVRAAIDISDGLLSDLGHLCRASGVGARLWAAAIPTHPHLRQAFGAEALRLALTGGEDYELLFTVPQEVMARARQALSFTVIGQTRAGVGIEVVDETGAPLPLSRKGWEHFVPSG